MTSEDPDPIAVEHSIELDAEAGHVLEALTDPTLLAEWLGDWRSDADGATVTTDDGIVRRVDHLERTDSSVTWTWSPAGAPGATSEVAIVVAPLEGGRSRLTVSEVVAAGATAPSRVSAHAGVLAGWAVALLMLQVMMALRAAVPALA